MEGHNFTMAKNAKYSRETSKQIKAKGKTKNFFIY